MNSLDPNFFIDNIRDGYRQRKDRADERGNAKMMMDASLFALISGSNQVVHNRGRALAYMNNADKKRRLGPGVGGNREDDNGDEAMQ